MTLIAYDAVVHQDLRDTVSLIVADEKNTVLDLFMQQNMAADQVTHKWTNKKMKGYRDTLNGAINNSVTTAVVADGANKFIVNNVTYIKIDDEYLKVTAGAGTNSLTVVRGALGSSAASHSDGAEVFFVELEEEGADNSRNDSQSGSTEHNICQIFRRELKLSGTSQAVKSVGGDAKWETQTEQQLRILLQKLRLAFVTNGVRYADADESLRLMAGLPYYITNKLNAAGTAVNRAMIEADIIQLLENGADPNDLVMLAPTRQVARINDMKVERVIGGGMSQSEHFIDNDIEIYKFNDANVKIARVPEMPRNQYMMGERKKASINPLNNRSFKVKDIGDVGDSVQKLLVGEYTSTVMNGADAWLMRTDLLV